MGVSSEDFWHMRSALGVARQGLGRTWPNPAVGCVLVKNGVVIARARTADGGRPHAEKRALAEALACVGEEGVRGACAYVTLEPCAHQATHQDQDGFLAGSCADALVAARIARVVIAVQDPDPRTAGRGEACLRAAGVDVETGILESQARALNAGFFLRWSENRPFVTLKTATTIDSRTACRTGRSLWITGAEARAWGHRERARHDAIAFGIGTVLADDPVMSTRVMGVHHDPVRVLFDTNLRLPDQSRLLRASDHEPDRARLWVVCGHPQTHPAVQELMAQGVVVISVDKCGDGLCMLPDALAALAQRGITRLLVEGGARLHTSFLMQGLFDRLLWFRAPRVMGGDGLSALGALGVDDPAACFPLNRLETHVCGEDILEIYARVP